MAEKKKSRKELAFELFDKGYTSSSPEVKALKLRGLTRYTYYSKWKKQREQPSITTEKSFSQSQGSLKSPQSSIGESIKNLKERELTIVRDDSPETNAPEFEANEDEIEVENEVETEGNEQEADEKEEIPTKLGISKVDLSKIKKDGKKAIPRDIIGQGITVTVELSVKTLALYQYAANMEDEELTLGDFLDTAAEDMYRVRGKDLGIVQIRRE